MLTLASAELYAPEWEVIANRVSADVWEEAVLPLDAEGVRAHLLDWNVSDRAGFESVVEILYDAGVRGNGLVFLREERGNALGEIRGITHDSSVVLTGKHDP